MPHAPDRDDAVVAAALLDKVRDFATGLAPDERRCLALLLAPGIAAAWGDEPEVAGFVWRPDGLADHLALAVRARGLRVEGWT